MADRRALFPPGEGEGQEPEAKGLEGVTGEPTIGELRGQQAQESESLGLGTEAQWHGALIGAAIGAVVGGLLLLGIGLVAFRDTTEAMVLLPIIGVAFGAVAGGVYKGGSNPELEGELKTTGDEPDPSTAVESNPPPVDD